MQFLAVVYMTRLKIQCTSTVSAIVFVQQKELLSQVSPRKRRDLSNKRHKNITMFVYSLPEQNGLKGIVSRDFSWLQIILKDRAWVPGIPLEIYFFKFIVFI